MRRENIVKSRDDLNILLQRSQELITEVQNGESNNALVNSTLLREAVNIGERILDNSQYFAIQVPPETIQEFRKFFSSVRSCLNEINGSEPA